MTPSLGVLSLMDKICAFMDIEELEKLAVCWRLFWYVATLDRLLEKFQPSLSSSKSLLNKSNQIDDDLVENQSMENNVTRRYSDAKVRSLILWKGIIKKLVL